VLSCVGGAGASFGFAQQQLFLPVPGTAGFNLNNAVFFLPDHSPIHLDFSQTLAITASAVPLEDIGAGVPGLIAAGGGLLAWWRRKRRAQVVV
jgi:hypothetical protein